MISTSRGSSRSTRLPLVGILLATSLTAIACQSAPGGPVSVASPGVSLGTSPSAGPSDLAPTGPSPSPSQAVATASALPSLPPKKPETVVGSIFNEGGGQIEGAKVEVTSADPAFNRMIDAPGGAFAVRDVPVGTTLTLRAFAAHYTTRTRVLNVTESNDADPAANRVDFGGTGVGMFYYLTEYPDITSITPANLATGVASNPLELTMRFSHAIRSKDTIALKSLLRVRFQAPGGDEKLVDGTQYRQVRAQLTWNDAGTEAYFTFNAPLVTNQAEAAVTVGWDPDLPPTAWPLGENDRRLGRAPVSNAKDGAGTRDREQVAPFARQVLDEPRPAVLPSPLVLWGLTHFTTTRFSLARDRSELKVIKVEAFRNQPGKPDLIELTFNKAVRGFPESALRPEITAKASYRYVTGTTVLREQRVNFEEADPAISGSGPSGGVGFDERDPTRVTLTLGEKSLDDQTQYKLYIDPKVEDITGTSLGNPKGQIVQGDIL